MAPSFMTFTQISPVCHLALKHTNRHKEERTSSTNIARFGEVSDFVELRARIVLSDILRFDTNHDLGIVEELEALSPKVISEG
jgi:hypothetical protein